MKISQGFSHLGAWEIIKQRHDVLDAIKVGLQSTMPTFVLKIHY